MKLILSVSNINIPLTIILLKRSYAKPISGMHRTFLLYLYTKVGDLLIAMREQRLRVTCMLHDRTRLEAMTTLFVMLKKPPD